MLDRADPTGPFRRMHVIQPHSDERAGWGTIANRKLKILMISDAAHTQVAGRVKAALDRAHTVQLAQQSSGWRALLHMTQQARLNPPSLLHTIGAVRSAGVIARGLNAAWVLSISAETLRAAHPRAIARLANKADALSADSEQTIHALRAAGLKRSAYVLSHPDTPDQYPHFLGAIEIIYGRILAKARDNSHTS